MPVYVFESESGRQIEDLLPCPPPDQVERDGVVYRRVQTKAVFKWARGQNPQKDDLRRALNAEHETPCASLGGLSPAEAKARGYFDSDEVDLVDYNEPDKAEVEQEIAAQLRRESEDRAKLSERLEKTFMGVD